MFLAVGFISGRGQVRLMRRSRQHSQRAKQVQAGGPLERGLPDLENDAVQLHPWKTL